jgi:predicted secreted protein
VLATIALLAMVAACQAPHAQPIAAANATQDARQVQVDVHVDVDSANAGKPCVVNLRGGELLRVHLPGGDNGFGWTLDGGLPAFLRMETAPSLEPEASAGARRTRTWSFRAFERGRGSLRFAWRGPWEAESSNVRATTVEVVAD